MKDSVYIEAGKIINTHGIAGDVVAESYCDSPDVLRALPSLFLKTREEYVPLTVKKASFFEDDGRFTIKPHYLTLARMPQEYNPCQLHFDTIRKIGRSVWSALNTDR